MKFLEWFLDNWKLIVPIILSLIAIIFTAFKDFILPWFFKPKLEVTYEAKEPYKRQANIKTGPNQIQPGFFYRFKIKNIGKEIAKNCRYQIYSMKDNKGKELDLNGFPLRWGSRPDSNERLNISLGESEFVDLANTRIDKTGYFYFEPYHKVPIGMNPEIQLKNSYLKIIVSGDNFKPYFVTFEINGEPKEEHILEINLEKITRNEN